MKKLLSIMAAAALGAGLLAGCSSTTDELSGSIVEEVVSGSGFEVESETYHKSYTAENASIVLGSYSYTLPKMKADSENIEMKTVSDQFNNGVSDFLDREVAYWDDAMEDAQKRYDIMGSEEWAAGSMRWSNEITYSISQSDKVLSVKYQHNGFCGGAHGYTYYNSQLFDLKKGTFIDLSDVTDDPEGLQAAVVTEILRQIDDGGMAQEFGYWDDYEDCVERWMDDGHSTFFREKDAAMEIIFPAYELAPYSSGEQAFYVGRDVYEPCLNAYGLSLTNSK